MKPGDWYWFMDDNFYHVVQVIEPFEASNWLVRSFWPKAEIPTDSSGLEVKSECTEIILPDSAVFMRHSELPANSNEEKQRYFSIKNSLEKKNSFFENGMAEAKVQLEEGNFQEAMDLLNNIGLMRKRDPEIYLLRARCFLGLGDEKSAGYDYDFYVQLGGRDRL